MSGKEGFQNKYRGETFKLVLEVFSEIQFFRFEILSINFSKSFQLLTFFRYHYHDS